MTALSTLAALLLPSAHAETAAVALGRGASVVDVGRLDEGAGPVALLVETPGLAPRAFVPLVRNLEAGGLEVYTLRLPVSAQTPDWVVAALIPAALDTLPDRPTVLVGVGPGGTLAALATLELPDERRPDGLALLGAPLQTHPRAVFRWLGEQHTPGSAVALRPLQAAAPAWGDEPVIDLLLGDSRLPLGRLSGAMADAFLGWGRDGVEVSLAEAGDLPIWAGAGSLDHLAPVESIRPALRSGDEFHRYGRAALLPREFTHADLLLHPRPARDLARWAHAQLAAPSRRAP